MGALWLRLFCPGFSAADPAARLRCGQLAGITGIGVNGLLCALKLLVGVPAGSIAVVADGLNNLTDAAASLVTFIGFKLAAAPSDREHPYGHARIEYLAGLFTAAMILLLGGKLLFVAGENILRPQPVAVSPLLAGALIFSLAAKLWLTFFYYRLADLIASDTLRAAGADSRSDVAATGQILLGFLLGRLTGLNLDGWLGAVVALFIMYSGLKLIRETGSPLLGRAPAPALVEAIRTLVLSPPEVLGLHDLVVHDYGPGRLLASVHAELDVKNEFLHCHEIIDAIELEAGARLGVCLVIHPDPVDTDDPLTRALRAELTDLTARMPGVVGIHDLRLIRGAHLTKVVFDVVLAHGAAASRRADVQRELTEALRAKNPGYCAVITFETDLTGA
ncbi:MAG: cation diffusion facilitator family transporter [Gracilibacteraceae bacterium]|nr:cation diffusion facilitator family transporter [Gracilibacteraceae bacterium]